MQLARRILIVEDDPLIRGLVSAMLTSKGYEIRTAASAAEAREIAEEFDPDLALLDIELGEGPSGVDLALVLRAAQPTIALVFLTHIPEPKLFDIESRNIPKDAGYLFKARISDPGVLESAIDAVLRGKPIEDYRDDKNSQHTFSALSKAQIQVIKLVALGLTNAEIAERRGTTLRAVENLLHRAFEASGISVSAGENARIKMAREYIKATGMPLEK